MPDPTKPESTTHDDGSDDIAAQLRRYADAAERTVSATPTTGTTGGPRRSARPWLAAAAVVALLGGSLAAFALIDDGGDAVRTVDQPPVEQFPDIGDACPAPRAAGPRVDDLRVLLPSVAAATPETTTDGGGRIDSMRIVVGKDGVGDELRVAVIGADELAETFPVDPGDDDPVTFEICDPFAAADRRRDVRGHWAVGQDQRLHAELGLDAGDARAWLVTASTPLDGRDPTREQPGSARADLRRLIAGMSWPAPVGAPRRNDDCSKAPIATVGDHELLAAPEGYTLGETQEMETGAVDMGGERWTRLGLLGPDGAQITVVSISTATFSEALESNAVGIEPGSLTIQRCRTTPISGGDDTLAGTDELTEIRRTDDRIVIGAQEWEYGGWMVVGSGGATEEDVIAAAEAFRS